MRSTRVVMLGCLLGALASTAWAEPAVSAEGRVSGAQQLKAAAETTIQRLPTCEATIRARVSDWQARAAVTCRKSAARDVPACVDAQLKARADQLQHLRSCRFF